MNPNGNKSIGNTKKYGPFVREKISKIIRKEWAEVKNNPPSAEEFAEKAMVALKAAGIKSPDGSPLTIRGVKYQVQRTGITFKGRVAKMRKRGQREVVVNSPTLTDPRIPEPDETPVVRNVETHSDRLQIAASLSAIPKALAGILEDETLTPKQRRSMFEAYFELNE